MNIDATIFPARHAEQSQIARKHNQLRAGIFQRRIQTIIKRFAWKRGNFTCFKSKRRGRANARHIGARARHQHNAVLAAGETESGCTVHWADEHFDTGSVIAQRHCAIDAGMNAAQLAARVFEEERLALPEAVAHVAHWLRHGGTRPNFNFDSNRNQKMN